MSVPTLPGIGVTPSIVFFQTLEMLALVLVMALLVASVVPFTVLACHCILIQALSKICSRTPKKHWPSGYHKYMKTAFLCVGRQMCVNTFPALFKMHKTRSDDGSQMKEFMVFLDRNVENSSTLIATFCCMAFGIFCLSTKVFLRYFPVERSAECLEKDSYGQSLFCYSNVNSSLINSNLPVDCASYSVTELRELQLECYAITLPGGLGIAVAAALGLAKVGIVGVTICVKITEAFFTRTKNLPQNLQQVCCHSYVSKNCANVIYLFLSGFSILFASAIISACGLTFSAYAETKSSALLYIAYSFLPTVIANPMLYVIFYLSTHCDKGEYLSIAADQRLLDRRDWGEDSESSVTEGQQGEASRQGESDNINGEAPGETEERTIEIYENNGSIE